MSQKHELFRLGKVGIVMMLEGSRLARNNSDWYRLIEICGLTGTLIADENAIYNPREPNDRLLLGVKGTLSEAELFTLRKRLYEVTPQSVHSVPSAGARRDLGHGCAEVRTYIFAARPRSESPAIDLPMV